MNHQWQRGKPTKTGYYLATWLPIEEDAGQPQRRLVSELWFNIPDPSCPQEGSWWPARGYLEVYGARFTGRRPIPRVIAWMPMPPPADEESQPCRE